MAGNDEMYKEEYDGMGEVGEMTGGVVDTGDLEDYEAATIPVNDVYKLKVITAETKKIEWDEKNKDGSLTGLRVSANILELGIKIIESQYKNPYSVRKTIFLPDPARMNEQQLNGAKGAIIMLKEALFGPAEAKVRGFDCNAAVGCEFMALVNSKPNKKDPERTDLFIKRYKLD